MSALEKLSVLVVDDNKHVCTMLSTILRAISRGRIKTCTSPAEAFELLHSWQPGMIITDYRMSPTDGLTFTRELRSNKTLGFALKPILLMTGETPNRELVEEVKAAGVDAMITKPIVPETLIGHMEWSLDHAGGRLKASLEVDSAKQEWAID